MDAYTGKIKTALISVSDKTDLIECAQALVDMDVSLLASGGTAKVLQSAGIPYQSIESFTGTPEILDGRVKTLHPRIYAGILADRRVMQHMQELEKQRYTTIDLVICNLYPFAEVLQKGATREELIENIDIGGPTLVRAAAKNAYGGVTVVVDHEDYVNLLDEMRNTHAVVGEEMRVQYARKAFTMIEAYDSTIARWMNDDLQENIFDIGGEKNHLRYGENPHQNAHLLKDKAVQGIAHGMLKQGKTLSYNNYLDMDAAYRAVYAISELTGQQGCSIVKHTNTCGLALGDTQAKAFELALAGDPIAAFGGILGFNDELTADTAACIRRHKLFVECIVAPSFSPEACDMLSQRTDLRLFQVSRCLDDKSHAHRISGGWLVESLDQGIVHPEQWQLVTQTPLQDGWLRELQFAMQAAGLLKSNAITITRECALLGCGAGHMSRIDAAKQAVEKAGKRSQGAFMGSDAFFPFADCVQLAAEAGIVAIVQPGGSKRDQESIDACNALGIAMLFTGRRHFRH